MTTTTAPRGAPRVRLCLTRRTLLDNRMLEPGDLLSFDPSDASVILAVELHASRDTLASLLDDGAAEAVAMTADEARRALVTTPRATEARVLPFVPRLER